MTDAPAAATKKTAARPKTSAKAGSATRAGRRARPSSSGKYNAKGEYVDLKGKRIFIPSLIQAVRLRQLIKMEEAGLIGNLQAEVRYPVVINNLKAFDYRCDHVYDELDERGVPGRRIYEEVKGFITPEYRLKKKVFQAVMQVKISEISVLSKGWVSREKGIAILNEMWEGKIPD